MHREVRIFLSTCDNEVYFRCHNYSPSSSSASLHSVENNKALLSRGALLACGSLLVSLGGAVAEGNQEDGMELV